MSELSEATQLDPTNIIHIHKENIFLQTILFETTHNIFFICSAQSRPLYLSTLDVNSMFLNLNISLEMISQMMKLLPRLQRLMIAGRRYSRHEENINMFYDHRNKQWVKIE